MSKPVENIRLRIIRMHRALARMRTDRRTTARFTSHFHTSEIPVVTSLDDTLYHVALSQ